jgi:hypothetical protein
MTKPDDAKQLYPIVTTNDIIEPTMTGLAGTIVKHKLTQQQFIIEGFVIEDAYYNPNDFKVDGCRIKYKFNSLYSSLNDLIYHKIITDGKRRNAFEYFGPKSFDFMSGDENLYYNFDSENNSFFYIKNGGKAEFSINELVGLDFNFYLYEHTFTEVPACAADRIYVLCKYFEDKISKYMIFNLNEITQEI